MQYSGEPSRAVDFVPYGYDERQYCSPGFDLGVGCLMRSVWGEFPEYHTSADNLEFLDPARLEGAVKVCRNAVEAMESDVRWRNLAPYGEPQLGRRGLYGATGGVGVAADSMAMLWVLSYSDGRHSLLDIAGKAKMEVGRLRAAAEALHNAGLLEPEPL